MKPKLAVALRAISAALILLCSVVMFVAQADADPFIPKPGKGKIGLSVRLSDSYRRFSTLDFGANTGMRPNIDLSTLRLKGSQGLGDRWGLEYSLGENVVHRMRGARVVDDTGLGPQYLTLLRGLTQRSNYADALGLKVYIPSPLSRSSPGSSRHVAFGPELEFGFRRPYAPHRRSIAGVSVGALFYFGEMKQQLRFGGYAGTSLSPALSVLSSLRYVDTIGGPDRGRSVLRGALELEGTSSPSRPFVRYEVGLAGRDARQWKSLSFGITWRY
jgi:hypothetical protein